MHKAMLAGLVLIVLASAGLTIAQLWIPVVSWDNYIKLIVTFGIVALVLGFLIIIKADFGEKKKLKDENYLD
jgi:large-conductance mechanosensitive channel